MILDLEQIIKKYNFTPCGVIHVGAHHGQEYPLYKKLGFEKIIMFEPVPHSFDQMMLNTDGKVEAYQCALGNENKKIMMNIEYANQGQSSSILKPKLHLTQYPHIKFDELQYEVDMCRLDDLAIETHFCNFLNIDVQGYELEVLKGAKETLKTIDFIITEVNNDEVYENCAKVADIDKWLYINCGMVRAITNWEGTTWGDALYIKQELMNI
jgi:FkbM family methyltransferase